LIKINDNYPIEKYNLFNYVLPSLTIDTGIFEEKQKYFFNELSQINSDIINNSKIVKELKLKENFIKDINVINLSKINKIQNNLEITMEVLRKNTLKLNNKVLKKQVSKNNKKYYVCLLKKEKILLKKEKIETQLLKIKKMAYDYFLGEIIFFKKRKDNKTKLKNKNNNKIKTKKNFF